MAYVERYKVPDLNDDLREQIEATVRAAAQKASKKSAKTPVNISSEQWEALHSILTAYTNAHNEWLGYFDREQSDALNDVAKNAERLGKTLEEVQAMGLSWAIDNDLENGSVELLAEQLAQLAKIDGGTPRVRERNERDEVVPGFAKLSRAELHSEMKAWWRRVTGSGSVAVKEERRTPFSQFLELAYCMLPEEISPGWSPTTVKDYNRAPRQLLIDKETQAKLSILLNDEEARAQLLALFGPNSATNK